MKYAHGLALLVWFGGFTELRAQFPVFPPGPRYPVGGVGFSYQRRHLSVNGFWGNPGYGFGMAPVYAVPGPSISIVYQPPLVVSPPIIINNQPIVFVPDRPASILEDDPFLRIVPRQREMMPEKPRPPEPRPPARPPENVPAPREPKPPVALRPSRSDRLLDSGRQAFADQLYGRAERFFAKAAEVPPVDPLAFFYLGQAQFARAEYQEAVLSLQSGLRIYPDWVRTRFGAGELYGPHANDFQEHLKRLEETLARHPADPFLLFLFGYELWFSGRQDEARAVLQRALRAGADAGLINLFLNVPTDGPLARSLPRTRP